MPPVEFIDMDGLAITKFDMTVDASTAHFVQMLKFDGDLTGITPPLQRIIDLVTNDIDESQRPSVSVEDGLVALRFPFGVKSEIAKRHSSDITTEVVIVLKRKLGFRMSGPVLAPSSDS